MRGQQLSYTASDAMTQTGDLELDFSSPALAKFLPIFKDSAPITIPVIFADAFSSAPKVMLGISGFRGGGESFKFKLTPSNITATSFKIIMTANRNWIDSIHVSWLATDA